jgi:DNA-binding winged helix-turn-helix (wHTH) protein
MLQRKLRFGEFELNFGRFELCRNGTPVHLEGLPLRLLMLLIENHGNLMTREQIAQQLWGKDVFVDIEQGINTAIRKIRVALQDDFIQPRYLQTVVGRGYRFVSEIDAGDGTLAAEQVMFSAEDLGRAVMAAAGLDPEDPKGLRKVPEES